MTNAPPKKIWFKSRICLQRHILCFRNMSIYNFKSSRKICICPLKTSKLLKTENVRLRLRTDCQASTSTILCLRISSLEYSMSLIHCSTRIPHVRQVTLSRIRSFYPSEPWLNHSFWQQVPCNHMHIPKQVRKCQVRPSERDNTINLQMLHYMFPSRESITQLPCRTTSTWDATT